MSEIYQLPESNSSNNATIPFSIPIGFGGMGGGFGNSTPSIDYLKKTIEEDDNKEKEQMFAIPAKQKIKPNKPFLFDMWYIVQLNKEIAIQRKFDAK